MSNIENSRMNRHDNFSLSDDEFLCQLTKSLESLARGNFSHEFSPKSAHHFRLSAAINQISSNLKAAVKHMNLVAQGRYDIDFEPATNEDELGIAISDMTEMLREMSYENKKSAWIKSGQAELSNIIRGDQNCRELGKNILSFLARYINALVGTIYQVSLSGDDTLELIGSFAVQKGERGGQKIHFGEGLIGQCALEKEQLVFSDFPSDYLTIGSSLGQARPKQIIVTPFLIEKEIVGVMELGVVEAIDQTKIELLRQVSENIAIALKSSQNSERLKSLLNDNNM